MPNAPDILTLIAFVLTVKNAKSAVLLLNPILWTIHYL